MSRRALSLVEVLIAAVLIGVSAVPILELVRSGTARLEVSEIEVAARQLGSDVLERVAGPRIGEERLPEAFERALVGQGVRWSDLLDHDAAIAAAFPKEALGPLLDLHEVRVRLEHRPDYKLPAYPQGSDLEAWLVTVSWTGAQDTRKEATFARLIER